MKLAQNSSIEKQDEAKDFVFLSLQLESVAKISNLQYTEVLQSYGNPIY